MLLLLQLGACPLEDPRGQPPNSQGSHLDFSTASTYQERVTQAGCPVDYPVDYPPV